MYILEICKNNNIKINNKIDNVSGREALVMVTIGVWGKYSTRLSMYRRLEVQENITLQCIFSACREPKILELVTFV